MAVSRHLAFLADRQLPIGFPCPMGIPAVLQQRPKKSSGLSGRLTQLTSRSHHNVAGVALAKKLACMACAVLAKYKPYRSPIPPSLLANHEITQRSNPVLSKPVIRKSLPRLSNSVRRGRRAFNRRQKLGAPAKPYRFAQTNLSLSFFACDKVANHTFRIADNFQTAGNIQRDRELSLCSPRIADSMHCSTSSL